MKIAMNAMTRLMLIACLVLPFAACKKEEATKAVAATLSAPANDDGGTRQAISIRRVMAFIAIFILVSPH